MFAVTYPFGVDNWAPCTRLRAAKLMTVRPDLFDVGITKLRIVSSLNLA